MTCPASGGGDGHVWLSIFRLTQPLYPMEKNLTSQNNGAVDFQPVRELVEEILEGGREALETRRRKYGF